MKTEGLIGQNGSGVKPGGIFQTIGDSELAKEFITAGKTFHDALARTTIRDPNQLYFIVQLWDQLNIFDFVDDEHPKGTMLEEKQGIISLLIGFNAIEGENSDRAIQTHGGLFFPRRQSKEERKAMIDMYARRKAQKDEDNHKEEEA